VRIAHDDVPQIEIDARSLAKKVPLLVQNGDNPTADDPAAQQSDTDVFVAHEWGDCKGGERVNQDLTGRFRPCITGGAMADNSVISTGQIAETIHLVRGQRVILDSDLAALYGVLTKNVNLEVRRNQERFPQDFMFQLTAEEYHALRLQFATSKGRGGHRYAPYVFTEHGVAMLSSVLNSPRAVAVNIEIIRAFIRLRHTLSAHSDLTRRLDVLEKKYDAQFKVVFDAIGQLMTPPPIRPSRGSAIRPKNNSAAPSRNAAVGHRARSNGRQLKCHQAAIIPLPAWSPSSARRSFPCGRP
jgi:hypothetical protein